MRAFLRRGLCLRRNRLNLRRPFHKHRRLSPVMHPFSKLCLRKVARQWAVNLNRLIPNPFNMHNLYKATVCIQVMLCTLRPRKTNHVKAECRNTRPPRSSTCRPNNIFLRRNTRLRLQCLMVMTQQRQLKAVKKRYPKSLFMHSVTVQKRRERSMRRHVIGA